MGVSITRHTAHSTQAHDTQAHNTQAHDTQAHSTQHTTHNSLPPSPQSISSNCSTRLFCFIHSDYLTKQAVKKDRAVNQAHHHHGAMRPDDVMGAYYRGGTTKDANAVYHPNKKAGQSMHSKIGWKSSLSTGDDLAIADPGMQAKVDAMEKLIEKQKAWTRVQKRAFENTNERYLHMWNIVKEEITKEHDREYRLLSCDVHSNMHETQRWVGGWQHSCYVNTHLTDTLIYNSVLSSPLWSEGTCFRLLFCFFCYVICSLHSCFQRCMGRETGRQ